MECSESFFMGFGLSVVVCFVIGHLWSEKMKVAEAQDRAEQDVERWSKARGGGTRDEYNAWLKSDERYLGGLKR